MVKYDLNKLLNVVNSFSDTVWSYEVSNVSSAPRSSELPKGTIFQRIIGKDKMTKKVVKIFEVTVGSNVHVNVHVVSSEIYDFILKEISFDCKKLSSENQKLKHENDLLVEYDYKPSFLDNDLILEEV